MENNDEKPSVIESNDIESRIFILKRRAAEADFLREERDMLISRLKLYNPDYIWPDSGINRCLNMPTNAELQEIERKYGELTEKTKQLLSENENLKNNIKVIQQQLEDLKKNNIGMDTIIKENTELKESMKDFAILKEEKEQLLIKTQDLSEDLNKMLEISGSADPNSQSKFLLQKLYTQVDQLSIQKVELQNSLYSKDIQIDVLNGKISHLNAKLNEPYIATQTKLCIGQELSKEEGYMWAVRNLEMTNKKMNCDLQKITEQLNLVTEKYMNMQQKIMPMKSRKRSASKEMTSMQFHEASFEEKLYKGYHYDHSDIFDIYEKSEKGSTAPVSRDLSVESMFHIINRHSTSEKLKILANDAQIMGQLHYKLMILKRALREIDAMRKGDRYSSLYPRKHVEYKN